jgi:hypothetical protein
MTASTLLGLGWSSENIGDAVVGALAVAGAAALGALGSGWLVQLLCRLLSTRPVPRPVLFVVRLLGAVALGWAVALWVFGSGGPGWGRGGGGWGFGSGGDQGSPAPTASKEKDRTRPPHETPATGENTLRVEVLNRPASDERIYRLAGESELLTLKDVQRLIAERKQQGKPYKNLIIVLYKDSPDEWTAPVNGLRRVARENGMAEGTDKTPTGYAPQR